MKAIVLAAGFATRMYPLTKDRAKPLLDVGGRPVLSWILDRVLGVPRVDEVVVVTNGRFHAQFEEWLAGYESRAPIRLVSDGKMDNDSRLGAVNDLSLGMVFLSDLSADFLVVAGDNLIDFDLAPFAARFEREGKPLLLLREIPGEVPPRKYNEVAVDADGNVTSFREKPDEPTSNLSALCLYFLPADARADLGRFMRSTMVPDAPGHFIAWLSEQRPLVGERVTGPWFDIGSVATLEAAREVFAERGEGEVSR